MREFSTTEITTISNIAIIANSLGIKVEVVECLDGLKLSFEDDVADIAINSATYGIEGYGFTEDINPYLTVAEATQLLLDRFCM